MTCTWPSSHLMNLPSSQILSARRTWGEVELMAWTFLGEGRQGSLAGGGFKSNGEVGGRAAGREFFGGGDKDRRMTCHCSVSRLRPSMMRAAPTPNRAPN